MLLTIAITFQTLSIHGDYTMYLPPPYNLPFLTPHLPTSLVPLISTTVWHLLDKTGTFPGCFIFRSLGVSDLHCGWQVNLVCDSTWSVLYGVTSLCKEKMFHTQYCTGIFKCSRTQFCMWSLIFYWPVSNFLCKRKRKNRLKNKINIH